MESKVWNPSWYSRNAARAYPLVDSATKQDTTGSFTIPDAFIVSMNLSVHIAHNVKPTGFFIKGLAAYGQGFVVTVGYDDGVTTYDVAVANISRQTHLPGNRYPLLGVNDFSDATGGIVVAGLEAIDEQPKGSWAFDLAASRLEPETIRPQIRGVTGLRVQNGSTVSEPATGDVILRSGDNIRFTFSEAGESSAYPVIVVDAISGENLAEECECENDLVEATPIKTINGVEGNASGDFPIELDDCLEIEPLDSGGIKITNPCSQPCCGSEELDIVTRALEQLQQTVATYETVLVNLEASVSQTDQSFLASFTGDRGCNTCS